MHIYQNALNGQQAHSPGHSEPTTYRLCRLACPRNREQREGLLSLCRGAKEEKPRSGLSDTLGIVRFHAYALKGQKP